MTSNMKRMGREGEIAEGRIKAMSPYNQSLPSSQLHLKSFHSFVPFSTPPPPSELTKTHPSSLTEVIAWNTIELDFCRPSSPCYFRIPTCGFCWLYSEIDSTSHYQSYAIEKSTNTVSLRI
jgi:hypothetical protein